MKKEISRRNFIKGTAALTAGAALMGLVGCAEEKTPAPQEAVSYTHLLRSVPTRKIVSFLHFKDKS